MSLLVSQLLVLPQPPAEARLILLGLAYLLTKHALADYFLQSRYQWHNKGTYGHFGGLVHGALHALLTAPVFLIIPGASLDLAALLLAAEFLVHYHVDWLKEHIVRRRGWTAADAGFWQAIGIDQLVHGLTYIAIVWVLVSL
jgi:hypothetical protein